MHYPEALNKLKSIGEEAILNDYASLSESKQHHLLEEIESLSADTFRIQQLILRKRQDPQVRPQIKPVFHPETVGSERLRTNGLKLVAEGKVGCLLVAGGQGTRLSFDAPKGTYPVSLFKKKSLFQMCAERVLAAGRQANRALSLAIMTSPQNHQATVQFFRDHGHFGLQPEQLSFFMQAELPILDDDGHLILQDQDSIVKGPTGNGSSLDHFLKSGIWKKWREKGIELCQFILVDNPLADPFDAELIGFHQENGCEVTIKCIERQSANEQAGLLVETDQGVQIVEYSEIEENESTAIQFDGALKHRYINSGLYCFSMDFIKRAVEEMKLPWHLAYKSIGMQDRKGWKFETFIFDYFVTSLKTKALLYPREKCFAPLKNNTGESGIEKVQEALLKYDLRVLEDLVGQQIPPCSLELDMQFYYPTPELRLMWKDKQGPFQGYIQSNLRI